MKKLNINKVSLLLFVFLTLAVSISQFILASKHLQMGFFTDDWLFLSIYRSFVTNPIQDMFQAWKQIGSHNFGYVYYLGFLYNFFELDYSAYRTLNQIFKIFASLTLYPLVFFIFRNKTLAFISTFIYGIHFASFGLLDGPSRGKDFLAIGIMNIFLTIYLYISKKGVFNFWTSVGLAIGLFTTILMGPTRLFPLLAVIILIEVISFLGKRNVGQLKISLKRLSVLYSPLLFLYILSPSSISVQLNYSLGLLEKLMGGNLQLLLTPFASLGSTYIPKEFWIFLGTPIYQNFNSYVSFFVYGPLFMFLILSLPLAIFISREPFKFIFRILAFNLLFGGIVFFVANNWLTLDRIIRTPVDPGTFIIPALIGMFVFSVGLSFLSEWKEKNSRRNKLLLVFTVAPIFSLVFTFLTWIFADINSIFTGVHAYLNIPSIGTSVVIATILVLIYERLKTIRLFHIPRFVSILIIVVCTLLYFGLNFWVLDNYFTNWLKNGVSATDQERVRSQFWKEVDESEKYSETNLPLIYLETDSGEYENGAYYSEVIIWRMASWFDLKFKEEKEMRFNLCEIQILGRVELHKFVRIEGKKLISDKCKTRKYDIKNFYSFKFKDRNLVPNKKETLKELGITD